MKAAAFTADDPVCPMNYPGFMLRELLKLGYPSDSLLQGTGLTQECFFNPNMRIEFSTLRLFVLNALRETGDPHLGPKLANSFDASYIGAPAYAAMNAPNFRKGLEVFGRFAHLTFPAIEFTFLDNDRDGVHGEAEVRLQARLPLDDIAYFVTASAFQVVNNVFKGMLRRSMVVDRCELAIAEPSGWADIASELTTLPVRFDGRSNRIIFSPGLLDAPLPGADPINHQRLIEICERFSSECGFATTPVSQVRAFLERQNSLGLPLSEVASALGYSERGLRRQLERCGCSYRKLVEEVLEARAKVMLLSSAHPISVIAYELGYETPSNFARSFRRWTGETPKAFRLRVGAAKRPGQ
jgi:AraC-like DNA-binding protein